MNDNGVLFLSANLPLPVRIPQSWRAGGATTPTLEKDRWCNDDVPRWVLALDKGSGGEHRADRSSGWRRKIVTFKLEARRTGQIDL